MARPATGAPRWNAAQGYWEARVTIGDERKPVPMRGIPKCSLPASLPTTCVCENCSRARRVAKLISDKARLEGVVPSETREVANEWYERYHAYQIELGQTDAVKKRSRWNKWISPIIGTKPMSSITRDDIEDVRDALDKAIAGWKKLGKSPGKMGREISGKTAMNVWSCLTSSFRAAASSKRRDLRALDGKPNPCVGVEPPGDRDSRQARRKTFIYPREAAALLACEDVPFDWRVIYAIALYLYARPGELRVLTCGDVDLEANVVKITKAWDYEEKEVKSPKTRNGIRSVPIHPSLRPLLERLIEGRAASDLLIPALSSFGENHLAQQFRAHLLAAGVDRVELHTSTRTHVQANFRSCRDTGITWLAMSGLSVDRIMKRAGHDEISTTMGYVKQAEDLSGDLGTPFPALPEALVGSGPVLVYWSEKTPQTPSNKCRRRESKPSLSDAKSARPAQPGTPLRPPFHLDKTKVESARPVPRIVDPGTSIQATVSDQYEPPKKAFDDILREAIAAATKVGDKASVRKLRGMLISAPSAPFRSPPQRRPKLRLVR